MGLTDCFLFVSVKPLDILDKAPWWDLQISPAVFDHWFYDILRGIADNFVALTDAFISQNKEQANLAETSSCLQPVWLTFCSSFYSPVCQAGPVKVDPNAGPSKQEVQWIIVNSQLQHTRKSQHNVR